MDANRRRRPALIWALTKPDEWFEGGLGPKGARYYARAVWLFVLALFSAVVPPFALLRAGLLGFGDYLAYGYGALTFAAVCAVLAGMQMRSARAATAEFQGLGPADLPMLKIGTPEALATSLARIRHEPAPTPAPTPAPSAPRPRSDADDAPLSRLAVVGALSALAIFASAGFGWITFVISWLAMREIRAGRRSGAPLAGGAQFVGFVAGTFWILWHFVVPYTAH